MESNENNNSNVVERNELIGKKFRFKKTIIAIGVLLLVVGGYQYLTYNFIDSQKQKFADKIKKSLQDKQNKYNTPTIAIDKTNKAENQLVDVSNTNGAYQVGDLSVQNKNADLLLTAAIRSGDYDRVKVLAESGINLSFTNNKLCIGKGDDRAAFDVPANTDQLKHAISMHPGSDQFLLMTDCTKLFILDSVSTMRKMNQDREFYTANNYGFSDQQISLPDSNPYKQNYLRAKADDEVKMKIDQKREDIFNFLMDKTNFFVNGNAEQLPFVYRNAELPYSVRLKALKAYIAVKSNPSKIVSSQNVEAFNALSKELVNSVASSAKAGSYRAEQANNVNNALVNNAKQTNILDEDLKLFTYEFSRAGADYVDVTGDLSTNPYYLQNGHVSFQSEAELSVNAFKEKGISYKKDKSSMLYWTNVAGRGFYSVDNVNGTIALINTVLDSGLTDINRQYGDGSTILHYIAEIASGPSEGKALSVLNRYLLNKDAKSNLVSKKGETALEVMMKGGNGNSNNRYSKLIESYTSANFIK